ncbi:hypothetical protein E2C01_011442 [Portunus trituberculatus]|uniref:Uncharacterized protein n=1 Tax=Portunus trituberculatus TaxID=210409 RepID=A0A5B7DBW9_PORTR|nr:hypothetical protein [Portunus trituberculatus]
MVWLSGACGCGDAAGARFRYRAVTSFLPLLEEDRPKANKKKRLKKKAHLNAGSLKSRKTMVLLRIHSADESDSWEGRREPDICFQIVDSGTLTPTTTTTTTTTT